MRTLCSVLLFFAATALLAHADSDDLSGGVLLVHAPPNLVYTTNPSIDWCDSTNLASCEDQVTRVDEGEAVWYILSAWDEVKSFCAVEFGLGDYDSENYIFEDYGLCLSDAMALFHPSSQEWPGPNTGIALVASEGSWSDSLAPICWFVGYAYAGTDTIAITENPASDNAGWLSGVSSTPYEAECLGALGIGAGGAACCPESGRDSEEDPPGEEDSEHSTSSPDFDYTVPLVPRVVIASISKDAFSVPEDRAQLTLADAISDPDVRISDQLATLLEDTGVLTIERIFPEFDPAIYDRHGRPVLDLDGQPLTVPNDLSVWFRLSLDHDDVSGAISRLRNRHGIRGAEPSRILNPESPPTDTLFAPQQWNLHNYGQYCDGSAGYDINFLAAWDSFGVELPFPVPVGILDTGIDSDHEDLLHVVVADNYTDDDTAEDKDGHGTQSAGVIGMAPNNDKGGVGIAPADTMVNYKVLYAGLNEATWTYEAIDDALTRGVGASGQGVPIKVVNLSLGRYGDPSELEGLVLQNACASGMACIAAAGNEGYHITRSEPNHHYPSDYGPLVCSVNAFIYSGQRWEDVLLPPYFDIHASNWGQYIDLTAPGGRGIAGPSVPLPYEQGNYMDFSYFPDFPDSALSPDCNTDDNYLYAQTFPMTSAAAPHVTGVIAAVLSCNSTLSGEDGLAIVIRTAVDHDVLPCTPDWDGHSGWGRPDLFRAMQLGFEPVKERGMVSDSGAIIQDEGTGIAFFKWTPEVERGDHSFRRWKVTKTVQLENSYENPIAWSRIEGSCGWRMIEAADDEYWGAIENRGYVTIEELTSGTIRLATYFYDVTTSEGTYRVPCDGDVTMSFTVVEGETVFPSGVRESDVRVQHTPLVARPNPSQRAVSFSVDGLGDENVTRIQVLTLEGRVIRELVVSDRGSVEWDLLDDIGHPVPAGIYFVRGSKPLLGQPRKLVVVR
ncbi:MAG: S8 family serine peptidase [Candidatus Eisenbacteria sp.]|nr:S8 family serine peptidase [Candidatus Eisenbacteria bacterium]